MTVEEIIAEVTAGTDARARFSSSDNMIEAPTKKEYEMAIYDAVEDINMSRPVTSYSLEVLFEKGRSWQRVLYLATEINLYQVLVKDWVANGMDAQIEDLSLSSKLPDYQNLLSTLQAEFKDIIAEMKAGGPIVRGSTFSTMPVQGQMGNSAYLEALRNALEKNRTLY